MKEKLYAYLCRRQGAVPSMHLVREVMGLQGASPRLADTLVASAVAGDARFERTEPGWQVKSCTVSEARFVVVQKLGQAAQLAFAVVEGLALTGQGVVEIPQSPLAAQVMWQRRAGAPGICAGGLAELLEVVRTSCVVEFKGAAGYRALAGLSLGPGRGELECDYLSLRGLAQGVMGTRFSSPEALAQALGIPVRLDETNSVPIDGLAEMLIALLEQCGQKGLKTLYELLDLAEPPVPPVTWSTLRFGPDFVRQLPSGPGVYLMLSRLGEVLYVGKARNLRQRLRSYFQPAQAREPKVTLLRQHLYDIRIEQVGSELEALLVEHRLIRRHDPPVNRQLAVHPRPLRANTRANRIVIMPSVVPGAVELFFASRAGALRQLRVQAAVPEQEVKAVVAELYFCSPPPQPDRLEEELAEILFSWLEQNADRVSWIEIDATAGLGDCVRLVKAHVANFVPGTRQILR